MLRSGVTPCRDGRRDELPEQQGWLCSMAGPSREIPSRLPSPTQALPVFRSDAGVGAVGALGGVLTPERRSRGTARLERS